MAIVDTTDARKGKSFILDAEADLASLPTSNIPTGSTAFVIATSTVYMINSNGEWTSI